MTLSLRSAALVVVLAGGTAAPGCVREDAPKAAIAADSVPAPKADSVLSTPAPPVTTVSPAASVAETPPVPGIAPAVPAGASALELEDLRAALDVPVAGVVRAQLRDSYLEARGERMHEAMDILAPRGTPVISAADGRLLRLFDSRAGGLMIYATDATGRFILFYGHLDRYAEGMVNGMPLTRGQVIGYVGTTGNAPPGTPHLHFGILRGNPAASWSTGVPVNPYPLLSRRL